MAILNLTPDSFSDGGNYNTKGINAIQSVAAEFVQAGAEIIDVGGQSTRPGAEEVGEEEELARVIPAIHAIRQGSETKKTPISIDTYRSRVAEQAILAGANLVNDISAGKMDDKMLSTIAKLGCTICLSHSRGTPKVMNKLAQYSGDIVKVVGDELRQRVDAAEAAGIRRWRLILDPGIGFAKTTHQNLELIGRLSELRNFEGLKGLPWLVGTSRKRFIGQITNVPIAKDRVWGTAATTAASVAGGADIIRVHDVAEMAKVAKMADAIWRGKFHHEVSNLPDGLASRRKH
ncbi:MAG: trifunctional dihydropteroate synthetase [Trizodia sp. TS-e1964]|nr:MAG: trifunctional dihydropteroate synthetase [Trizodia sp. TS-e1964]